MIEWVPLFHESPKIGEEVITTDYNYIVISFLERKIPEKLIYSCNRLIDVIPEKHIFKYKIEPPRGYEPTNWAKISTN